ncbi:hypothetical protein JG688_00002877 [Phytophthora aleatoria]|uniref:RxLR effector PexRD54 WY domain-containing protein n=1 Tax=Phytophthora aleatoria TaxID=2496075 RepID=A0A8J5JAR5_9STRA|nr:hypothetical protein JG688_00002877 [Phytophthora aleatoria]
MLFQRLHVVKAGGKLDDNPEFIQWLQYAIKYRDKLVSDSQTLKFQMKEMGSQNEFTFGTLFQSIKGIRDVAELATNFQTYLFQKWIGDKLSPKRIEGILGNPDPIDFSRLKKSNPKCRIFGRVHHVFCSTETWEGSAEGIENFFRWQRPFCCT